MSIRSRLARLQKAARLKKLAKEAAECLGCAPRMITMHNRYRLANGESVVLPPFSERPPCTCGRGSKGEERVSMIVVNYPDEVATREQAEQHHAKLAAMHQRWERPK